MVGPDFERPEAAVSEAWIESAVVAEPVEHREWWKNFEDPVLVSLIQTAYEQNLTLQIAGLRVHEARAILGLAAGNLYPQNQSLGASASTVAFGVRPLA